MVHNQSALHAMQECVAAWSRCIEWKSFLQLNIQTHHFSFSLK